MFCAAITARIVLDGGQVLWVDYEQGERHTIERLLVFGLTDEEIASSVYRVHHPIGFPDAEFFRVYGGVTLAVFDGFTGLLGAFGGNSNSADDVERVYNDVLRPLKATGTSALSLDHVVKDKEGRGSWAFGSQRKISAPDHAYSFDVVRKFRPGAGGQARVKALRDRAGGIDVMDFMLEGDLGWRLEADVSGIKRLTGLMYRISRYLEEQTSGVSGRTLEKDVEGKSEHLRYALATLIEDAYVSTEDGPGGAILHTLIRRYRESEDPKKSDASRCVLSASGRTRIVGASPRPPPT
jgi:hypothetical protein